MPNMAKWFFIVFIAMPTFVMNAAAVDAQRGLVGLLYSLAAVNVFALSLFSIWLSFFVLVFGVFMLWPSLKLLYGMTSRSTRSREKTRAPG